MGHTLQAPPPLPTSTLPGRCEGERPRIGDLVVDGEQQRIVVLTDEQSQGVDVSMRVHHQTLRLVPVREFAHRHVHDESVC
jgi:hypothetical protein